MEEKLELDSSFWEEDIEEMLESGDFDFCEDFLSDVLRSISYSGIITKRQIAAIENIKAKGSY